MGDEISRGGAEGMKAAEKSTVHGVEALAEASSNASAKASTPVTSGSVAFVPAAPPGETLSSRSEGHEEVTESSRHGSPHHTREVGDEPPLERLLLLTDGVYAIAMTLLALDLRLPTEADTASGAQLLEFLLAQGPMLLAYLTSFTVIALFWSLHHRTLRFIKRLDGGFVWLTMLHLCTVAFIPFPTRVIGQHLGDPVAEEFYYASMLVITILSASIWWYATWNRRLLGPEVGDHVVDAYRLLSIIASGGLLILMIFIRLGLARIVEPLVLGYVFTLGFIFESILFPIENVRRRRPKKVLEEKASLD